MSLSSASSAIYSRLASWIGPFGSLRGHLVRGGLGSGGVMAGSMLLSLTLAIVLARMLGPEGYGIYIYVFTLVSLLSIPIQTGIPTLVVRETAAAHTRAEWGLVRGVWRWANIVVAVIAVGLVVASTIVVWLMADHFTGPQLTTFAWGLALVPLIGLGNLPGAALRGLNRVVQGQIPDQILRPGVFVLLLVGVSIALPEEALSSTAAMALHALAAAVAFIVGAWLLLWSRPPEVDGAVAVYRARPWLSSAVPLALLSTVQLINNYTDIIILGLFVPASDVGIYRVAAQGATIVVFGLMAINTVVAPHFARLHATGDRARLQRVVTASARVILLWALPVAAVLIVFGEGILQIVFGNTFASGHAPLAILAAGQIVNAALGSVTFLLNMTGHERDTARGVAVAAAANVLLNLALIPPFGMVGAAIATAASLVLWNFLLWRSVRIRIGIDSMAFRLSLNRRSL